MITAKLNLKKIDKDALFRAESGAIYLDVAFIENKNGRDEFGNDGFVAQSISKERREAGERGPIIGNWKRRETRKEPSKPDQHILEKSNGYAPGERDDIPY